TYTLSDTLKPTDTVDWAYAYAAGGPAGSIAVEDDEVLSDYTDTSGIGTACAKANSTAFPLATLSGTKYKDADADGDVNDADAGIAGFDFTLYTGSNGDAGTQVGTAQISAADGSYSFANVAPGTYSVVESPETGWSKTFPATFHTVTVSLGDTSKSIGKFLNAPLTDIFVEVDPQTGYTFADSIQCRKGATTVGTDVNGTLPGDAGLTKSVDANGLLVGTYICTIVITDP
ncbi:MAG TPA: SdrD B-like domain-containing protein, partial [Ornithinibacter sp.]|nr:SdrD B-like domain-containing protein [Ornithinibacter sp.]